MATTSGFWDGTVLSVEFIYCSGSPGGGDISSFKELCRLCTDLLCWSIISSYFLSVLLFSVLLLTSPMS